MSTSVGEAYERRYQVAESVGLPLLGTRRPDIMVCEAVTSRVPTGGMVVEVGCGDGCNAQHLASLGYRVIAIDYSSTALRRARLVYGIEDICLIQADATDGLPFGAACADAVLDIGCVHLFANRAERERVLAGYARVLAPGGVMVACVADALAPGPVQQRARVEAFEVTARGRTVMMPAAPRIAEISIGTWADELQQAGILVERVIARVDGRLYPHELIVTGRKATS